MTDRGHSPRHAQVYYDLSILMRAAAWLWRSSGVRVSVSSMARTLGLRPNTLGDMVRNTPLHITLSHMGLVAWYFGVSVDQILRYGSMEDSASVPELEEDLARLSSGEISAQLTDNLPQLARRAPPLAPPGSGAVLVINRQPELLATVTHGEVARLTGRPKSTVSRYVKRSVQRLARNTLADWLEAFGSERVSAVLDLELNLEAYSSSDEPALDAVRIVSANPVWRSIDWAALAKEWRAMASIDPPSGELDAVDIAAIRYIYTVVTQKQGGRVPRLGGQLAAALNVTRQAINGAVSGEYWPTITPLDLPPPIQQLIHERLKLPPLEDHGEDQTEDQ